MSESITGAHCTNRDCPVIIKGTSIFCFPRPVFAEIQRLENLNKSNLDLKNKYLFTSAISDLRADICANCLSKTTD